MWLNSTIASSDIINFILIAIKPNNSLFYREYYKNKRQVKKVEDKIEPSMESKSGYEEWLQAGNMECLGVCISHNSVDFRM